MAGINSFTIGLPVRNLGSAIDWYKRLLGNVETVNPAPGVWEFQIVPSGWLQLLEGETSGQNLAVVRFESDDIEVSRELALTLGTDVSEIETVPGAVKYFEFRDPFGNQLSFYEILP
jgi:lactoylglutathione lyase